MKKSLIAALALAAIAGCTSDADRASQNLSTAADNFEVNRRIVFYNGMTNDYMLSIEGLCSIGKTSSSSGISVTCKTGPAAFKKHMLGLSDNVTYFVEQREPLAVSTYHYRVVFKPANIIPDLEVK
jgi:hypothetical protein